MTAPASSALSAIAILAASLSLSILTPASGAIAADACLTKPDGPAPQGSRWYYRLEHPSKRKCWRLVGKDQKEQRVATRKAPAPQPADDETGSMAAAPATPAAEPPAKAALAPVVTTLITRNVSNTEAIAPRLDSPAPRTQLADASAAAPAVATSEPAPVAAAEAEAAPQVPPVVNTAPAGAEPVPTLNLLLLAIALLVVGTGVAIFAMALMRRRTDVLVSIREREQRVPLAPAPEIVPEAEVSLAPADEPSFAPLPPMTPMTQTSRMDDIEEAIRQLNPGPRRRAA